MAWLYASKTPRSNTPEKSVRTLDAPAVMTFCASTVGANFPMPLVKPLVKIDSAKEVKRAPPKYWLNTTIDVPIAASATDNVF
jgi:hypothetical protein